MSLCWQRLTVESTETLFSVRTPTFARDDDCACPCSENVSVVGNGDRSYGRLIPEMGGPKTFRQYSIVSPLVGAARVSVDRRHRHLMLRWNDAAVPASEDDPKFGDIRSLDSAHGSIDLPSRLSSEKRACLMVAG